MLKNIRINGFNFNKLLIKVGLYDKTGKLIIMLDEAQEFNIKNNLGFCNEMIEIKHELEPVNYVELEMKRETPNKKFGVI